MDVDNFDQCIYDMPDHQEDKTADLNSNTMSDMPEDDYETSGIF